MISSHEKVKSFFHVWLWRVLLVLIFIRPFLSEHAFLQVGFWYTQFLIASSLLFLIFSQRPVFGRSNFTPALLAFTLTIIISIIFSSRPVWSFSELFWFIPNILIFYVISKASQVQRKNVLRAIVASAGLIAIYALYQYYAVFSELLAHIDQIGANEYTRNYLSTKRVFATFISPNICASFILMMSFVIMSLALDVALRKKVRLLLGVVVVSMLTSLFLTKSLGAILVFAVTLSVFVILIIMRTQLHRHLPCKNAILIIIVTLVILLSLLISGIFLKERLGLVSNLEHPQNPIMQRFYYWKASFNAIKDFPLTGLGWRNFGTLYMKYKVPEANISHYSHNLPLQILTEAGPLGLMAFAWLVVVWIKEGKAAMRRHKSFLPIGLFCATSAFLLHNLVDLSFYFGQASFYWWILLGLLAEESFSGDKPGDVR